MRMGDFFFAGNWHTVPLEGLTFPGGCSKCGEDTDTIREIKGDAKASVFGVLGQFAGISEVVTITIPHCTKCQAEQRRRRVKWMIAGLGVGAVLGGAMAWSMSFDRFDGNQGWQVFYRGAAFFIGVGLGLAGGWYRGGQRLPVRIRRYSDKEKTLQIWFENPDYRKEFDKLRTARPSASDEAASRHGAKGKRRSRKR